MLTRALNFTAKNQLARNVAKSTYTYLPAPGSGKKQDVTLIPGSFIGPELTSMFF
jgi:hypothetical protein